MTPPPGREGNFDDMAGGVRKVWVTRRTRANSERLALQPFEYDYASCVHANAKGLTTFRRFGVVERCGDAACLSGVCSLRAVSFGNVHARNAARFWDQFRAIATRVKNMHAICYHLIKHLTQFKLLTHSRDTNADGFYVFMCTTTTYSRGVYRMLLSGEGEITHISLEAIRFKRVSSVQFHF